MKNITIIGTGKMAYALIDGLKDSFDIEIVGRDLKKLQNLKKSSFKTTLFENFDSSNKTVILAVKPYALDNVSKYFKSEVKLLISVLAGTKIEKLKENIKAKSYIRCMPNLCAVFKKYTPSLIFLVSSLTKIPSSSSYITFCLEATIYITLKYLDH